MLDILQLRRFDLSHIQVYSLRICSLSLVPRGSLVFSVVNLVFVLVVLSISLCKCRFLDLYLVFLCFTSFGKSVGYLICSIALVPKVVIVSVLYFLVLHFVPFFAAILSVFVCKPRESTCCHLRARKEVLVHVRSADIL